MSKMWKIGEDRLGFYCPGCDGVHQISTSWSFNGDFDVPTVSPSVLVTGGAPPHLDYPGYVYRCHSFINAGRIQFLGDCSHELAGQTVDLPEDPQNEP